MTLMARGKVKPKRKAKNKRGERQRKSLGFGFFLVVCAITAGTGVFIVAQNQLAVSGELKARKLDQSISAETAKQKSLRIELAKLNSPARIARIAQEQLAMGEPAGVIYLKYTRDAQGNLVSQSSYEQRSEPAKQPASGNKTTAAAGEEPSRVLTQR